MNTDPRATIEATPLLCRRRGNLMRLAGGEPHPADANMDLLTYSSTGCGEFDIVPRSAE